MKLITDTLIQGGTGIFPKQFAWADRLGDWQDVVVNFPLPFPDHNVHIIVTPTNLQPDTKLHTSVPIPVIRQPSERGFLLSARNAEYGAGHAGFNWLAVHQGDIGEGINEFPLPDIRLGLTQPHYFIAHADPNYLPPIHRSDWTIRFSRPLNPLPPDSYPITLTSASSHGEVYGPMEAGFSGAPHLNKYDITRTVAAFGLIINEKVIRQDAIHIQGCNKDTVYGKCAFYWTSCALLPRNEDYQLPFPDLVVDSGITFTPRLFAPTNHFRDWQSWEVYFKRPFAMPPIVLVTATDQGTKGGPSPAVQGIATDVTPYGFSIAARNSDIASGEVNFYWLALGCGEGCG